MISGFQFVVYGTIRTKKNHPRRLRRGTRTYTVPSEAHEHWEMNAMRSLPEIRRRAAALGIGLPIGADVNCAALIYRHADVGDAVGFYESIADWMQGAGIVKNDVQVRSWDGTRLMKDAERPRVEITLDELPAREKTARKRTGRKLKNG